jgi:hypothetical protein
MGAFLTGRVVGSQKTLLFDFIMASLPPCPLVDSIDLDSGQVLLAMPEVHR